MMIRVADVLKTKPIQGVETIGARETIAGLCAKLRDRKIGAMVVTDESGAMAGVISERDVIRALAEAGEACLRSAVARYMTKEVQTAAPEDPVLTVLDRMTKGRFRYMPVLVDGELAGMVSIGDLVKARIEALQRENEALEEFIRS